ncbi:hypothetical protein BDV26DRAFT_274649 [Aspergillus bertholletiae]|uniref:Uncharacterized protein n=1 Tax=Aspergillus bertholletiae TaxID=1226010 RepID=A0A5N7ATS5_9EURO|nr:hypothetical protein BDV26DRAFT_274649 [Aspergillus bertholletiae]
MVRYSVVHAMPSMALALWGGTLSGPTGWIFEGGLGHGAHRVRISLVSSRPDFSRSGAEDGASGCLTTSAAR